ncbi:Phosphatase yihX [Serratia rubidaea]|uniref:Glucose-1-phosphatase n=1 Tax=Serratia rubidaea TaxID=61652 RepID=A0A126VF96_SERRU|nr:MULTISPECIES: glucose-1-phosphatase [Serratia]AGB84703.1 haloacid dehalogenase superfamily protein, subfamily IA, variant 3 with third motif having DD or ED [Serratia sp. FGI94]AML56329.1 Alpha-D-glucose-1-phosphatase [Serratia rubidaea]MBD8454858.1 glucose-1-phosphatase [Serratia rubidaea]MBH1931821.1 glucose-1-phosphatase [Serratia rubidaea]MBS0973760.1 glucose-1-phosphatase [Serratia rubidaea]
MLYIFDLGNVIVDIDFKRVLGVWSNLSGTPLAVLAERFSMGEVFQRHERGEVSDEEFAARLCDEMGIALSFEQFAAGWQAVFVALRPEVIAIMQRLRNEGHRVVVLSNTNRLHCNYWPQHYPEVAAAADHLYLSQDLGLRKPEPAIYQRVLEAENTPAEQAVFFDDHPDNIAAARALGMTAVWVTDRDTVPAYFAA